MYPTGHFIYSLAYSLAQCIQLLKCVGYEHKKTTMKTEKKAPVKKVTKIKTRSRITDEQVDLVEIAKRIDETDRRVLRYDGPVDSVTDTDINSLSKRVAIIDSALNSNDFKLVKISKHVAVTQQGLTAINERIDDIGKLALCAFIISCIAWFVAIIKYFL